MEFSVVGFPDGGKPENLENDSQNKARETCRMAIPGIHLETRFCRGERGTPAQLIPSWRAKEPGQCQPHNCKNRINKNRFKDVQNPTNLTLNDTIEIKLKHLGCGM